MKGIWSLYLKSRQACDYIKSNSLYIILMGYSLLEPSLILWEWQAATWKGQFQLSQPQAKLRSQLVTSVITRQASRKQNVRFQVIPADTEYNRALHKFLFMSKINIVIVLSHKMVYYPAINNQNTWYNVLSFGLFEQRSILHRPTPRPALYCSK